MTSPRALHPLHTFYLSLGKKVREKGEVLFNYFAAQILVHQCQPVPRPLKVGWAGGGGGG